MPRRIGRKGRKPRRKAVKRGNRKSRIPAAIAGPGQYATIVETIQFPDVLGNAGTACVFTLGDCPRAQTLSTFFSFYKAASVVWEYLPLYNTFQDGGGSTKPYIYSVMNRQQEVLAVGRSHFLQAGARPETLVSRKVVKYVPNWCSGGLSAYGGVPNAPTNLASMGLQKQFGWLATPSIVLAINSDNSDKDSTPLNPSTGTTPAVIINNNVMYNGHYLYIDQAVDGAPSVPCMRLTATVTWRFKGAKNNYTDPNPEPPKPPSTEITEA